MSAKTEQGRRALALFDELVDLDAASRAERLRDCHDIALLAEVQRMLDADARSGVFDAGIDSVMPTLIQALADSTADDTGDDLSGNSAGPFRIVRRIGRGGMGEVYLAERHGGDVQQQVALKVLKRGMESSDILRRFARERRILAQLNHPGIARFIDSGEIAAGQPYYAMEFVEGSSLNLYAQDLNTRARVELMQRVCNAVAYAHAKLVVHRDLKPSNVVVDAAGQPHILDFGIAKLLGDGESESTLTGLRAMSPAYAAPEQILGEPIGVAADVYALGVLLYELLTGTLPHRRNAQTLEGLVRALDDETAVAPSQALRHSDNAASTYRIGGVDGDLDMIVLQALKREPERRYVSASAFSDDLGRWLHSQPISARPDTFTYRLQKFVRRHRGGVLAATLTTLAILSGLGLALWQSSVAREQARRADAQAARADHAAEYSERLSSFLTGLLASDDRAMRESTQAPTITEVVAQAAANVDVELADQPELRARVLLTLGGVAMGNGDVESAAGYIERARTLIQANAGSDVALIAEMHAHLASIALARQQLDEAGRYIDAGLNIIDTTMVTDARRQLRATAATLYNAATRLAYLRGDLGSAIAAAERAIELTAVLQGANSISVGRNLNNLSVLQWRNRDLDAAERSIARALEIHRAKLAPNDLRIAYLLSTQARLQSARGDDAAALRTYEQAIAIARSAEPQSEHPLPGLLVNYGDVYKLMGRFDAARTALDEALRHAGQEKNRMVEGLALRSLGDIARFQQAFADSAARYASARDLFQDILGSDNAMTVMAAAHAAFARGKTGDRGAINDIERLRPLVESGRGFGSSDLVALLADLAELMLDQRRETEALALLRTASSTAETRKVANSSYAARVEVLLGIAQSRSTDSGERAQARTHIESGIARMIALGFEWHPIVTDARRVLAGFE
jgi:eukaryotic-like serine/threonine-protein kinase